LFGIIIIIPNISNYLQEQPIKTSIFTTDTFILQKQRRRISILYRMALKLASLATLSDFKL